RSLAGVCALPGKLLDNTLSTRTRRGRFANQIVNPMDRHFKIVLLLIAALCAACRNGSSETRRSAQDPPQEDQPLAADAATVKIVAPEYRTRTALRETKAKYEFDGERPCRGSAPVRGRVVKVFVRPGDVVGPGHGLLLLNTPAPGSAKWNYTKAVPAPERSEKALN